MPIHHIYRNALAKFLVKTAAFISRTIQFKLTLILFLLQLKVPQMEHRTNQLKPTATQLNSIRISRQPHLHPSDYASEYVFNSLRVYKSDIMCVRVCAHTSD